MKNFRNTITLIHGIFLLTVFPSSMAQAQESHTYQFRIGVKGVSAVSETPLPPASGNWINAGPATCDMWIPDVTTTLLQSNFLQSRTCSQPQERSVNGVVENRVATSEETRNILYIESEPTSTVYTPASGRPSFVRSDFTPPPGLLSPTFDALQWQEGSVATHTASAKKTQFVDVSYEHEGELLHQKTSQITVDDVVSFTTTLKGLDLDNPYRNTIPETPTMPSYMLKSPGSVVDYFANNGDQSSVTEDVTLPYYYENYIVERQFPEFISLSLPNNTVRVKTDVVATVTQEVSVSNKSPARFVSNGVCTHEDLSGNLSPEQMFQRYGMESTSFTVFAECTGTTSRDYSYSISTSATVNGMIVNTSSESRIAAGVTSDNDPISAPVRISVRTEISNPDYTYAFKDFNSMSNDQVWAYIDSAGPASNEVIGAKVYNKIDGFKKTAVINTFYYITTEHQDYSIGAHTFVNNSTNQNRGTSVNPIEFQDSGNYRILLRPDNHVNITIGGTTLLNRNIGARP